MTLNIETVNAIPYSLEFKKQEFYKNPDVISDTFFSKYDIEVELLALQRDLSVINLIICKPTMGQEGGNKTRYHRKMNRNKKTQRIRKKKTKNKNKKPKIHKTKNKRKKIN